MKHIKKYENFGSGNYASFDNSTGENFWGDIAGGVLPICKKTKRILLNLRSKYVNEPLTYNLFGGKLDGDENVIDAVKREFLEESGYEKNIELIPAFIFKSPGGFQYHNFIGIIDDEFEPDLNWESAGFKWVNFDELLSIKPKHPGLKLLLKDEKSLNIINQLIS